MQEMNGWKRNKKYKPWSSLPSFQNFLSDTINHLLIDQP